MLFHSTIRKELARSFGATLVVLVTVIMTMMLIRTLGQASKGTVKNVVVIANPETGGMRLSFELDPQNETLIELTAALGFEAGQTAETWAFRWTA